MPAFIKKPLIYLWSFWAWWMLLLVLTLFFPPIWFLVVIGKPWSISLALRFPRVTARLFNFLAGIKMKVSGREKVDFSKQHIFISNHNSNLDPMITGALVESTYKFLGKAEVLKLPVFGFVLRNLNVPVRRQDEGDRARSMADMAEAIRQGYSLIIYPEGTRNNTGDLVGSFHEGAFRLSIEMGIPIMILAAINSEERMPPNRWLLSPGPLFCEWSGPIYPVPGENQQVFSLRCREELIRIIRYGKEKLKN